MPAGWFRGVSPGAGSDVDRLPGIIDQSRSAIFLPARDLDRTEFEGREWEGPGRVGRYPGRTAAAPGAAGCAF